MIDFLEKRPVLTIIVVAVLLLLPNLNALEVSIMEARNFISAREMLTDGNWILTTLNGEPRYQKPPLPTWITALSAMIFGITNVWALRLPAALMVVFLGVGVFKLSRKLTLSKPQSLINGLVAITSLYVILIIFEAPWDIYAHTFILWSIYFLLCWMQKERVLRNSILCAVFLAASILSKGPVSLYVLFVPFLAAYFISFKGAVDKKRIPFLILIVVAGLLLGFSWYGYVRYTDPVVFERITAKETSNWSSYNVRPFYYYWSFFVQSGVWTIPAFVSLLYPYLKKRIADQKIYKFTVLWVLIAVVLLSVIPEKKSRYLMPVLIPLSLTVGFYLKYVFDHFKTMNSWREKLPVYVHFGLIGILLIDSFGVLFFTETLIETPLHIYALIVITVFLGSKIIWNLLSKKDVTRSFYLIVSSLIAVLWIMVSVMNTMSLTHGKSDFKDVKNPNKLALYSYKMTIPEIIWEYGGIIPTIDLAQMEAENLEGQFLILACSVTDYKMPANLKNYSFVLIDSIDLNRVPLPSRNYKLRKKANVYLATRE